MASRFKLHKTLVQLVSPYKVYFQPSENTQLSYPCLLYELAGDDTQFADNQKYIKFKRYKLTYIDRNPDSELPDKIGDLPMCSLSQPFTADGLYHWVFDLFY